MEGAMKEVDYSKYCKMCKNRDLKENEEPCWECLTNPVNEDTHRPVMFEERGTNNENRRRRVRNPDCKRRS